MPFLLPIFPYKSHKTLTVMSILPFFVQVLVQNSETFKQTFPFFTAQIILLLCLGLWLSYLLNFLVFSFIAAASITTTIRLFVCCKGSNCCLTSDMGIIQLSVIFILLSFISGVLRFSRPGDKGEMGLMGWNKRETSILQPFYHIHLYQTVWKL